MLKDKKIGFIGGGNMAVALLKGLLVGEVAPAAITVAEPQEAQRNYLADQFGVTVTADNKLVAATCDVTILAVKPQICGSVLEEISAVVTPDKLFISIMAGIRTDAIEAAFPVPVVVVRVMPNTPALIMAGASAICPGARAGGKEVALVCSIFDLVGKTWLVEEKLLDAVTGLSGSGPAYVLTFIEALADAGLKQGLSRETALGLATQTVLGTARLLQQTGEHPAVLRDKVTSPGGTTIAGLHVLEQAGFRGTVMDCVGASVARAQELGKKGP